jgi:hypothetical protein
MRNFLFSFVELLDTCSKSHETLHIPPDDCKVISEKINKIIKEYNIKDNIKDEETK